MATELQAITYESLSGIPVKLDAETVRTQLTRGNGKVTDQEILFFLRTCQARKLDPFEDGEVYIIKYSDDQPAQTVVGYHAYVRRADKCPNYRGYRAGITVLRNGKEVIQKEGCCIYKQLKEELLGGWCKVFRASNDLEAVETYFAEVSLDEYNTGKSNWKSKPATMIRKVAISQAFRSAFPNEYEGLYTIEEMEASGAVPGEYVDYKDVPDDEGTETVVGKCDRIINQEERKEMFSEVRKHFDAEEATQVLKEMCEEEGFTASAKLTLSAYERIMEKLKSITEECGNHGKCEEGNTEESGGSEYES